MIYLFPPLPAPPLFFCVRGETLLERESRKSSRIPRSDGGGEHHWRRAHSRRHENFPTVPTTRPTHTRSRDVATPLRPAERHCVARVQRGRERGSTERERERESIEMNPREEEEEEVESGAERKERVNGGEEEWIGDRGKEERKVKELRREGC